MNESPTRKKSGFWKFFTKIFLGFLACILLFVGLLPTILSSTWGKSFITKTINENIPGKIAIDRLSLSWFGNQKISNVQLFDPENQMVLNFESLSVDSSLMSLAFNPKKLKSIHLDSFNALLATDESGHTNLLRALSYNADSLPKDEPPSLVHALIKNMNANLELSTANSPFTLHLDGQTEQNSLKGQFNIDAKVAGLDSLNKISSDDGIAQFFKMNPNADLSIHGEVVNFPVELLDQLVALKSKEYSKLLLTILGPQLNIKVAQKTVDQSIGLNINASSPNMSFESDILIANEIKLSKPATLKMKIPVAAMDQLLSLRERFADWTLSNDIVANVNINNLELPLSALTKPLNQLDPKTVALSAVATVDQASFIHSDTHANLSINQIEAILDAKIDDSFASLTLKGDAANNHQPMKLKMNAKVPKDLLLQDLSKIDLKKIVVDGQIVGGPLFILDQYSENAAVLAELLGPTADINFSLKESNGKSICSLKYTSERFELNPLNLEITDKLTLINPTSAVMKIPPAVINQVLKTNSIYIQNPVSANLEIKSLNIPLNALSVDFLNYLYKIDLAAILNLSNVKLLGLPTVGTANLANFNIQIDANQKSNPEITLKAKMLPDGPGKFYDLIGKKANINASGTLGLGLDGRLTLNVFNANLLSELVRIDITGRIVDGKRLILQNPALISYLLTPPALYALEFGSENFRFIKPAPVQITIDKSHIPLLLTDLSALKLGGKIKIDNLQVQSKAPSEYSYATLDNFKGDWNIDGTSNRLDVGFSGVTLLGNESAAGKLNGTISVDGWHQNGTLALDKSDAKIKTVASNLPTQFLSSFSNHYDFVRILGNALNIDLLANIKSNREVKSTVDVKLSSKNLQGNIALVLNDRLQINENKPAEFHLDLTPEAYDAIRQMIKGTAIFDFNLTETAKASFKIKTLNFPVNGKVYQSGINASYSIDGLAGQDMKTKNMLAIRSMQGNISSDDLSRHVNFDINAKGNPNDNTKTSWNIVGSLDNAFSADGSLNKDSLSLQLDATIETLPISLICQFACVDPGFRNKLEAIIGPTLSASLKANLRQMNGPLYIDLQGKNGHLNVDAELNNGYLFLKKQATAQVAVTPQLSKYVFSEFIPIISGMLSADHPIKLTLDPNNFRLPLNNPLSSNAYIGKATLEMGKVSFSNSSQLAKVLSLLTPASSDKFMVWLTPVYFSFEQGVLDLKRVDMLISDRYPIAAWGNVDFLRERVSMIFGLSGSAIQRAFNVSGIPNSYLLQIPLRGKLDNPSFDKTKAAARLSAIVAQTQGGPQGLVLGTVLDIASGGLTESAPPSPTTNPLPWAGLMQDPEPTGAEKLEKQLMTPIEEVKKGASTILKKIFK